MKKAFATCVVAHVLLWALILPKVGGLILHLNPNVTTVVICTGSELVTLRLGPEGKPVETEIAEEKPCHLGIASLGEGRAEPRWVALTLSYLAQFSVVSNLDAKHDRLILNRTSQGPPFV